LEGAFAMGTFAKSLFVLFFGILAIVEGVIVYAGISQKDLQQISIIVPVLPAILALFLLLWGRWLGKGDIDWILDEIKNLGALHLASST
jgi:hypothetical protein